MDLEARAEKCRVIMDGRGAQSKSGKILWCEGEGKEKEKEKGLRVVDDNPLDNRHGR